jgi:hypothetical protein
MTKDAKAPGKEGLRGVVAFDVLVDQKLHQRLPHRESFRLVFHRFLGFEISSVQSATVFDERQHLR